MTYGRSPRPSGGRWAYPRRRRPLMRGSRGCRTAGWWARGSAGTCLTSSCATSAARGARIGTRDPGYGVEAEPDEVDALRLPAVCGKGGEAIRGDAPPGRDPGAWELLGEAIGLWRGNPLVDVPSNVLITAEVPRLDAL